MRVATVGRADLGGRESSSRESRAADHRLDCARLRPRSIVAGRVRGITTKAPADPSRRARVDGDIGVGRH
jgi:hypothetical protein